MYEGEPYFNHNIKYKESLFRSTTSSSTSNMEILEPELELYVEGFVIWSGSKILLEISWKSDHTYHFNNENPFLTEFGTGTLILISRWEAYAPIISSQKERNDLWWSTRLDLGIWITLSKIVDLTECHRRGFTSRWQEFKKFWSFAIEHSVESTDRPLLGSLSSSVSYRAVPTCWVWYVSFMFLLDTNDLCCSCLLVFLESQRSTHVFITY